MLATTLYALLIPCFLISLSEQWRLELYGGIVLAQICHVSIVMYSPVLFPDKRSPCTWGISEYSRGILLAWHHSCAIHLSVTCPPVSHSAVRYQAVPVPPRDHSDQWNVSNSHCLYNISLIPFTKQHTAP